MHPSMTQILASVRPLDEILQVFDLEETVIDVLKMDIEYNEWKVFKSVFDTEEGRSIMQRVNQIEMEVRSKIWRLHFIFM